MSNNGKYKTLADDVNDGNNNNINSDMPDNPVASVLRNRQHNVTDIKSLVELMRGAELSLAGRSDLLDRSDGAAAAPSGVVWTAARGRFAVGAAINKSPTPSDDRLDVDKSFSGILDLKITSASMKGFMAAAGPPFTVDRTEVEPFRWSESSIRHLPHYGHPDVWDYDLEGINWVWN